jgi:hypothetical protein
MILFIWDSIHKPHVDIVILVNSNFIFNGSDVAARFSKDVVISVILSISVFIVWLFIWFIGSVLKNIIVPKIVISVSMLFFMLFIMVSVILIFFIGVILMFWGLISSVIIMLDKMLVDISIKAILWLKIAFKQVYVNIRDVYLVTLSNLVISWLYLFNM